MFDWFCKIFLKKNYGPLFWMGFNCLKSTEPLRGDSLLFIIKFPQIPCIHLIDLGRMKGCQRFWSWDTWTGALTTGPLLHEHEPALAIFLSSVNFKRVWQCFFSESLVYQTIKEDNLNGKIKQHCTEISVMVIRAKTITKPVNSKTNEMLCNTDK